MPGIQTQTHSNEAAKFQPNINSSKHHNHQFRGTPAATHHLQLIKAFNKGSNPAREMKSSTSTSMLQNTS
eukprot:gene3198-2180_t